MMKKCFIAILILVISNSCKDITSKEGETEFSKTDLKSKIQALNDSLIKAAKFKDFGKVANLYLDEAILLAEYNPLIDGKKDIEKFYTEIFKRQDVKEYKKETTELFNFGDTFLEIGIFQKTFSDMEVQNGKYWNVWEINGNGNLQLKAETFGFFHHIQDPSELVIDMAEYENITKPKEGVKISDELKILSSKMERIVRERDTKGIVELYTDNGAYYPFADTTKSGTQNLLKHYTQYHSYPVIIDSISSETYRYEEVPDGVIRYTKFYVEWTVPDLSGKTRGTGMSYLKKQEDGSLKLHRVIGLHIYEEE